MRTLPFADHAPVLFLVHGVHRFAPIFEGHWHRHDWGEAKAIVDEGLVKVNDEPESRRRRKLRDGDRVLVALTPPEDWLIQA